jgi:hypothetical protein
MLSIKGKESKMQSFNRHQFNTMPKQVGLIASNWLAIECGSLSYDRTPEIISGSPENKV